MAALTSVTGTVFDRVKETRSETGQGLRMTPSIMDSRQCRMRKFQALEPPERFPTQAGDKAPGVWF